MTLKILYRNNTPNYKALGHVSPLQHVQFSFLIHVANSQPMSEYQVRSCTKYIPNLLTGVYTYWCLWNNYDVI